MLSLVTIEIEPSFRSLFYHDSLIIKTFCSREQSASHLHAHTFIELKNGHKELFLTLNCFSQEVLEPNFSMGKTDRSMKNFSRL